MVVESSRKLTKIINCLRLDLQTFLIESISLGFHCFFIAYCFPINPRLSYQITVERDQLNCTHKRMEIKNSNNPGRGPVMSRGQIKYIFRILFDRRRCNTNRRPSAKRRAVFLFFFYCFIVNAAKIIRSSITTVGRANGGGVKSIHFSRYRRNVQRSCGRTIRH